jgi:hypothetical protein
MTVADQAAVVVVTPAAAVVIEAVVATMVVAETEVVEGVTPAAVTEAAAVVVDTPVAVAADAGIDSIYSIISSWLHTGFFYACTFLLKVHRKDSWMGSKAIVHSKKEYAWNHLL